ncbi:4-hydroxy-tetrahydrodipicolinate reductase [archaeon D22]|nr:4-hydroxy-tetrahydrodipicolinate reductase [archaeon D22]
MVKISIVGYGGMGKMIEADAKARGIEIVSIISPGAKEATHEEINADSLKEADVVIDFTLPNVFMENLKKYCELKKDVVVGTTGWYDKLDQVKEMVKSAGIRFLWGSNFSVGVHMYFKIIEAASNLVNYAEDYDVWAFELHHHNKADSPSGTAKTLSDIMLKNIDRKKRVEYGMVDRRIEKDELHFASVRGGPVNFEHTIGLDSAADCITIKHAARNRSGYASGAVLASVWLAKQEVGYYEVDDFIKGVIPLKINFEKED